MNRFSIPFLAHLHRSALWLAVLAQLGGMTFAAEAPPAGVMALAYDAGSGTILKAQGTGVYRSVDEGASWQPIALPPALANAPITAIAISARAGGPIYVAGPGLGILRGDADGGNWTAIGGTLPGRDVTALATHATQADTLYAYLPQSGIYRSQDAGQSWKMMDRGPDGIRQLIHTDLAGSMESGWLYAATAKGASVSMDCFCLWRNLGELGAPVTNITYQPGQPETLYAAAKGGLFRSDDGGRAWEHVATPESAITALTVTPSGTVYAASVDGKLLRSDDRARTWKQAGA